MKLSALIEKLTYIIKIQKKISSQFKSNNTIRANQTEKILEIRKKLYSVPNYIWKSNKFYPEIPKSFKQDKCFFNILALSDCIPTKTRASFHDLTPSMMELENVVINKYDCDNTARFPVSNRHAPKAPSQ